MTRVTPWFLALALALSACKGDDPDEGSDDGGDGSVDDGGAGGVGGANVDNPSSGYDYFVAFGYRACELYEECTPEASAHLSYDQCIEQVDLAAAYYDMAFVDCSFDADLAESCWQAMLDADCDGYDGGESDCGDEVWICP